ncbi:MAG: hypothetical protein ACI8XZ_002325 [Gammaproteobacteria bacterium]|jgi:hypothetical protein
MVFHVLFPFLGFGLCFAPGWQRVGEIGFIAVCTDTRPDVVPEGSGVAVVCSPHN